MPLQEESDEDRKGAAEKHEPVERLPLMLDAEHPLDERTAQLKDQKHEVNKCDCRGE